MDTFTPANQILSSVRSSHLLRPMIDDSGDEVFTFLQLISDQHRLRRSSCRPFFRLGFCVASDLAVIPFDAAAVSCALVWECSHLLLW